MVQFICYKKFATVRVVCAATAASVTNLRITSNDAIYDYAEKATPGETTSFVKLHIGEMDLSPCDLVIG